MRALTRRFRAAGYGGDSFTFEFRRQPGGHYDIHCTQHPERPLGIETRRCHLDPATGKVDVASGREPRSVDRALSIAAVWAESFSHLIHRQPFPVGKLGARSDAGGVESPAVDSPASPDGSAACNTLPIS